MKGGYILVNGKFHSESEPLFTGLDLQRLGIGMEESFRAENNSILFAEDNYLYLVNGLSAIGLQTPGDWDLPRFRQDVSRLLNKNHLFLAARIHIYFIQGTAATDYILSAEEITRGFYPLNEPGLMLDFYDDGIKSNSKLNSFEPSSRFLWITAADSTLSKTKHNLVVFNNKGHACECISSSFAYIKDNIVGFPSRVSGGYQPPLIPKIIKCAKNCGFRAVIKNDISREDLLNADEFFIIDNTLGIQKVLGLDTRRFYSTKTIAIALKLKELAMKEVIQ